jgi:hypothetical protein
METQGPPVQFLNLEYFLRLFYELIFSGSGGGIGDGTFTASLLALISNIWTAVTILGFLFCLAAVGVFVYSTMRLYQVRKDEEEQFATISQEELHEQVESSRWRNVQNLMIQGSDSARRQAIIESDVILDELLTRLGYLGETIGEKLRIVNRDRFRTLDQAWEAHKVRNEIAHQGSAYQLTEQVAQRTIANYEAVFREHEEL